LPDFSQIDLDLRSTAFLPGKRFCGPASSTSRIITQFFLGFVHGKAVVVRVPGTPGVQKSKASGSVVVINCWNEPVTGVNPLPPRRIASHRTHLSPPCHCARVGNTVIVWNREGMTRSV